MDCLQIMAPLPAVRSQMSLRVFTNISVDILLKVAKQAMSCVLSKADLTDEELMTGVVGAEALMNSRHVTYQTSNVDDPDPLTTNHFLFSHHGGQFSPESDTEPYNP